MIYRYIDERKKKDGNPAPEAARHETVLMGHVFKKAVRWGAASNNPVRGIEKFQRRAKRPAVHDSDLEQVRSIASERMRCAIDLSVCFGARRADVLRLCRGNLTDEGIRFVAGKTQREQLIEWSEDLRAIVARCKALSPQVPGDYLIRTEHGQPYTASGFSANWQRLMRKHVQAGGQRFTFHDLRSVAASGGTLEEARDRLGHADASTTQRFYRRGVQRGRPRS
jgi:integrase